MNLNKFSTNIACRAELGEFPLLVDIKITLINYWARIKDLPENNLTKLAFQEQMKSNLSWGISIQKLNKSVMGNNLTQDSKQITNMIKKDYIEFWKESLKEKNKA